MLKQVWLTLLIALVAFAAGYWMPHPAFKVSAASKVYELRTYTTHPGKLDALDARFRDHTVKLFEKHGMENVGYWVPTDPKRSKDTLIYIVAHRSPEAAEKSWAAFREDPVWIKARDASEASGKIVAKIDQVYMSPTDYSPVK